MKTFENKETKIKNKDVNVTYKDLAHMCVNHVDPSKGMSGEEMRLTIRVIDSLQEESINLEDADADFLKQKVEEMKWAQAHKDILAFIDYVKNL